MGEIRNAGPLRHFRSEANFHITRYRKGRVKSAGKGLSFWFLADGASIAQIPMDDRALPFHFAGRTRDHQQMTVHGVLTWRVLDPAILRDRVDFTIDIALGHYLQDPLERITTLLAGKAQQIVARYFAASTVAELLEAGLDPLQQRFDDELVAAAALAEMGVGIPAARVADMAPAADLDRALRTPTFEALQQRADQATFERRALAVEKERSLAENELQNKIELARRERQLIELEDENTRNRARGDVAALEIAASSEAERLRTVETARTEMERARIDIYRDIPRDVMLSLAAREFAGKLNTIEHLNVTPDLIGHLLGHLAQESVKRLDPPVYPQE